MADITRTAAQIAVTNSNRAEIRPFIAGVTIGAGQAVYLVAATGKLALSSTDDQNEAQCVGIAVAPVSAAAGQTVDVCSKGDLAGYTLTGMSYGARAFVSTTDGELADAAGGISIPVGKVIPVTDSNGTFSKLLSIDVNMAAYWT